MGGIAGRKVGDLDRWCDIGMKLSYIRYRALRCHTSVGKRQSHTVMGIAILRDLGFHKQMSCFGGRKKTHTRWTNVTGCSEGSCVDLRQRSVLESKANHG